jgi:transcriptional regulator with XRE-family HTH domain
MPIISPHANAPALAAFGAAIRAARAARGMAQEALAHGCGIDRSYLGAIERGDQNPGLLHVVKIAEALGITVETLMKDAGL